MNAVRTPNTGRTRPLALALIFAASLAACDSTATGPYPPPSVVATTPAALDLPLIVDNHVAGTVQVTVLGDDYEFPVGSVAGLSQATFEMAGYPPARTIRLVARLFDEDNGGEVGPRAPQWVSSYLDLSGAQWMKLTLANDLAHSTVEITTEGGTSTF